MKSYILTGDPKEVDKVLRENRIRVQRGVIKFTPAEPEATLNEYSAKTLIESHTAMSEESQRLVVDNIELTELAGFVVSIAVEGGQTIPEEIAGRLAKFSIIVPKISETTENTAEIGENLTESVPNTPENANINSEPAAMDDKLIDMEDMHEVDLDADDKVTTPDTDDKKEPPTDDVKQPSATAKKTGRRKKTE